MTCTLTPARERSLTERSGESVARFTRPIDVGLEIYRALRALNGAEHGRKNLIAVLQRFDAIAGHNRRAE